MPAPPRRPEPASTARGLATETTRGLPTSIEHVGRDRRTARDCRTSPRSHHRKVVEVRGQIAVFVVRFPPSRMMIEHAERFLHARTQDETFEDAIVRANAWLATVLESPAARSSMHARATDFDGLSASPPVAIKVVGPPASVPEIEAFEKWLRARLPPSYRRFLMTLGQVSFLHRPHHPTYGIGAIRTVTADYREMIDEWFEGYDLEVFAEDWKRSVPASGSYRSWREWPNGNGVFHPHDVKDRNFVVICPGYQMDAHFLALHLADSTGEAPVFQNYPDDGAAFFLRGATFDGWMSSMVDDLIGASTARAIQAAVG
jgi:hypothetical protein